jgi:hypothetical protein
MAIQRLKDFRWGLDLNEPTSIDDNAFSVLKNMFYNDKMQLQTRRGYRPIFDSVGSEPFTSFYNYRNDEKNEYVTVWFSWTTFYALDSNDEWQSVRSNLQGREYYPMFNNARVRLDFAPYKWILYIADGVNPYAKYDGTTYTQLWITLVSWTPSFDHTTDQITLSSHGLLDNNRIIFGWTGTLPAELSKNKIYYVIRINANIFKVTGTVSWTAIDFTDNGSGTIEVFKSTQPKIRYLQYLSERMYWAWDVTTPQTLYYTTALPANAENIWGNAVIVWWDEWGVISGIAEMQQIIAVFKTNKIHAVNVSAPSIDAVDAQWGAYANRVLNYVNNGLLMYTDRGVDQLQARTGVWWSASLISEPMSDKVRKLYDLVQKENYRYACALFIPSVNQFYVSFDTDNDTIPDTTLVWNTKARAWLQYTLPAMYTFGKYETDTERRFVFAPAAWGQMFEFEAGFDDNWAEIDVELATKEFDFGDPIQLKTFDFLDVSGYKQQWWDVEITIAIDGQESAIWVVTDANIDTMTINAGLGITALGTETIGSSSTDTDDTLQLYPFNVRIPFYTRWATLQVGMKSSWVQWILTQMRVSVNAEPIQVFSYWDIL